MELLVATLSLLAVGLGGGAAWVWQQLQGARKRLDDSQHQTGVLQGTVERTVRDRDETVRRIQGQAEQGKRFSVEPLVRDLIESLDNFDRALDVPKQPGDTALREGLLVTRKQLICTLERHGITRATPIVGQAFDPQWQEAVAQQESDAVAPGQVLSVWVPGYRLHERLLRPARVVLAIAAARVVEEQPVDAGQEAPVAMELSAKGEE